MILLTDFPIFSIFLYTFLYKGREYIGHYSFILYFSQSGKLHILQAKYSGMNSSVKKCYVQPT